MKKKVILVLILIFFLNNTGAISISVSPPTTDLIGKVDERICVNFSISSDKTVYFSIENRWSMKNENNKFNDYNLSSQGVSIESDYPKEIGVYFKEKISFCVRARKAGTYNGIILFKSSEGTGAIGTLVKLRVLDEEKYFSGGLIVIGLMGINSLLMITLLFLLLFKERLSRNWRE